MDNRDNSDVTSSNSSSKEDDSWNWISSVNEERLLTLAILARLASDGAFWRATFSKGILTIHTPEGPISWFIDHSGDDVVPSEFERFAHHVTQQKQSITERIARLKTLIVKYDLAASQMQRVRDAIPPAPGRPQNTPDEKTDD